MKTMDLAISVGIVLCWTVALVHAESQWWDWEYQATDDPLGGPGGAVLNHPQLGFGGPTVITDCPECVGGKYVFNRSISKWNGGIAIRWGDKSQGFWPQNPIPEGCPGQADSSPFPHFGEAGWYIAGSGIGNPSCFAGGATIEIRYRWHGCLEVGSGTMHCDAPHQPNQPGVNDGNQAGLMPFAFPSMQYQAQLFIDEERGDYIEFATWGDRPEVDVGDDWIVVRMVMGSSWEGLDYYIHNDGSLEDGGGAPGNGSGVDTRGAAWLPEELTRVITQPNTAYGDLSQNNKGWKGFETAGLASFIAGSGANMDLDYIRWVFDKLVPPRGDVDQDGNFDVDDLAAIEAAVGGADPGADLDNNGIIDENDIRLWLGLIPTVPGDFNFQSDGLLHGIEVVDIGDFAILAGGFGDPNVDYFDGDANGDGIVDIVDFAILAGNYGFTGLAPFTGGPQSPQHNPSPEPASLVVFGIVVPMLLKRRSQRIRSS